MFASEPPDLVRGRPHLRTIATPVGARAQPRSFPGGPGAVPALVLQDPPGVVDCVLMARRDAFDAVLAAAQRGDEQAVVELYRDLHPRVSAYLRAREPRAAEDIEGEVWLAVATGLTKFTGGEEEFRGWVFSIARRRL